MKIDSHILTLYLDNQLSENEVRIVENALADSIELKAELELLRTINLRAVDYAEISSETIENKWSEFEAIVSKPSVIKLNRMPNWIKIASAAAVLFFGGLFFYNNYFNGEVEKLAKQTEIYTLPDGSELIMNAGSRIEYNEHTFINERIVQIDGDVSFRVTSDKNNPFLLLTDNSNIEVTGTKFRVYATKANTTVSLFSGVLKIKNKFNSITLKPGQSASCIENELKSTTSSLSDLSAKIHLLDFEAAALSEIVKNIERRFDVTIKYPQDIKNQKYTIKAEGLKLEEILTILTELTSTTVSIDGRIIELKS